MKPPGLWVAVVLTCLALTAPAAAQTAPPLPGVPAGFEATVFARPPQVNYPVCLAAAPTGELFVGIDKQGSLGRKKGEGSVVRCVDADGDGVAEKVNTFATMDHPRGLVYDQGKLWVLHPPFLTLYHDDNLDGVADRSETLVTGISTDQVNTRGGDHTTNGIRLGIDGWLYIAVGDFGCLNAKGTDGRTLTLKGGGVARVRPDGTELELYARGLRNIVDVAVDPQLNLFTRDNTNDGGGWDIRLSHIVQSADYGYPTLFKNFPDEIMPPLADYGGGSGCGALFVSEPSLPKPYDRALLTCDWGRGAVFYHPLTANGPTFRAKQENFVTIERPTDIDVDGSGRLYVSSWRGGQFNYAGENIGHVARVTPKGHRAEPFPDLTKLSDADLLQQLRSASHVRRLHAQRELLRRGDREALVTGLRGLMTGNDPLDVRVAAIFTFKQLLGKRATPDLVTLAAYNAVREFALRALADRKSQLDGVPVSVFTAALSDREPRVQLAALVGLGRLGRPEAAEAIVPLARAPKAAPAAPQPLVRSGKVKKQKVVNLRAPLGGAKKLFLVVADGGDGTGLDHAAWLEPQLLGPAGVKKLTELKWASAEAGWGGVHVGKDCQGRPLRLKGRVVTDCIGTHANSVIAYDVPPGYDTFQARAALDDGSAGKGSVEFLVYPADPGLAGGKQAAGFEIEPERVLAHVAVKSLVELHAVDACLKALDTPHRDGALWALRYLHDPRAVDGLLAKLAATKDAALRQGILKTLIRLYHREGEYTGTWWGTRPDTTGPYYHRVTWEASPKVEAAIRTEIASADAATAKLLVAELDHHRVQLAGLPANVVRATQPQATAPSIAVKVPAFDRNNPAHIGNRPYAEVLAQAAALKGDAALGAKLFEQQSCVACHTVQAGQPPLGPQLLDIGKRYNRQQLLESILKPSAQIAQGFNTTVFVMTNGTTHTGFVVREGAEDVEIRTAEGKSLVLLTPEIEERLPSPQSVMPEGLANNLTVPELAALTAYLEALRSE